MQSATNFPICKENKNHCEESYPPRCISVAEVPTDCFQRRSPSSGRDRSLADHRLRMLLFRRRFLLRPHRMLSSRYVWMVYYRAQESSCTQVDLRLVFQRSRRPRRRSTPHHRLSRSLECIPLNSFHLENKLFSFCFIGLRSKTRSQMNVQ